MCPPSDKKDGSRGPSSSPTNRQERQQPQHARSPAARACEWTSGFGGGGGGGGGGIAEKKAFEPYHSKSVPKSENLGANAKHGHVTKAPITTMMLRNIPNKYAQSTLMEEIDEMGFVGTYDFFYLPMDVHNRSNVGYAFINFTTADNAQYFHNLFKEHRFRKHQSRKISSVSAAHVQGLDANLRHFENRAVTHARNDQYRPVVLQGNKRIDFDEAVAGAAARASKAGACASTKAAINEGGGSKSPKKASSPKSLAQSKTSRAATAAAPKRNPAKVLPVPQCSNNQEDFVDALCGYLLSRQTSPGSTTDGGSGVVPPPGLESMWALAEQQAQARQPRSSQEEACWARQISAPSNFRYGVAEEALAAGNPAGDTAALAGSRFRAHSAGHSACGGSAALPSADVPAYVPLPSIPSISTLFVGCGALDDEPDDVAQEAAARAAAEAARGGAGVGGDAAALLLR